MKKQEREVKTFLLGDSAMKVFMEEETSTWRLIKMLIGTILSKRNRVDF